jgi:peptidoglycan/xylan/chitin deacetylase (PgdA/CDA1 family)
MFSVGLFASGQNLRLIVRLDDCYLSGDPNTERIIQLFAKYKTPINVGIIPSRNEDDTLNPMYLNPYTEIFVHGYRHKKEGTDEFSGLSYQKQWEKIQRGKLMLESKGIYPCCFAPPWNSYDETTLSVLKDVGYLVISGNEFGPKNNLSIKYIPSTCYSVKDALHLIQKGSVFNGIIVLLIHPYEFTTENDFILLEKLILNIRNNKIKTLYFSNLTSLDENITGKRLEFHHYPLLYLLRSNNILGFNKNVYYEMGSLIFINIIEWFLLIAIIFYLYLKFILKNNHNLSYIMGILLLLSLVISYINKSDSYRWVLLYKTSVIAFFIWLNDKLILRKKLKEVQAR